MKHKNDEKIIKALRAFGVYGFEAVRLAAYLLDRACGDVELALIMAKNPIKVGNRNVW